MAHSGELVLAAASDGELGRVVKWMADRTEPTGDTSAITKGDDFVTLIHHDPFRAGSLAIFEFTIECRSTDCRTS
jgi:hypothetical protein